MLTSLLRTILAPSPLHYRRLHRYGNEAAAAIAIQKTTSPTATQQHVELSAMKCDTQAT